MKGKRLHLSLHSMACGWVWCSHPRNWVPQSMHCCLPRLRADALPILNCGCCQCISGTWCTQNNKKMSHYLEEATNWYGGQAVSTQASRRKHCRSQMTHLPPPGVEFSPPVDIGSELGLRTLTPQWWFMSNHLKRQITISWKKKG